MDWQPIAALTVVAGTAAAFSWNRLRPRKFDFARHTHCGCSPNLRPGSQSSIVFHARRGEKGRILIKMK